MTAASDPYSILGLEPGASQAEIKRAYRRLAKTLHPDFAGERALPAFLAVQDAYERLTGTKVRTVRPPGAAAGAARASGDGGAGAGAFREPWRADPARARAAREQARTRRGAAGAGMAGPGMPPTGEARSGPAPGSASWARPGRRPGTASDADASTNGSGRAQGSRANGNDRAGGPAGSAGPSGTSRPSGNAGASGTTGRRRRSTRKATMGSTSYDEARDASDPRWAGASWYGPTTGEYWIVNPREYADPRRHGPGYASRVRSGASPATERPIEAPEPAAPRADVAGAAAAGMGRAAGPREAAGATSERWTEAHADPMAARHERPAGPIGSASRPPEERFLDSLVEPGPADPLRRLGLVLLAWAPIGIAAAAIIGQATGCGSYSVTCDGTDPFLPWVAQAVILGLLLLAAPLARVFGAGTIGLVIGLLPATAFVLAFGGSGSSAAAPFLVATLVIAWVAGATWGVRRQLGARGERDGRPAGTAPGSRGTP